jgi:nucleolar protein 9
MLTCMPFRNQEKIARSLIPDAIQLSNSQYGRFFARKLNLHLLERRPDEWREAQLGVKHHFAHEKEARHSMEKVAVDGESTKNADGEISDGKKRKRKSDKLPQDDPATAIIDDLFGGVVEKTKRKKTKAE